MPRTSVSTSTPIPSSRVRRTRRSTRSGSKPSNGLTPRWRIVAWVPARAATWANSNAMYPPPTNTMWRGRPSRFRNSSLVVRRSAPGNWSGIGMAPAAMRMRRPVSRSSPTTSVDGPTKRARPWNRSTPIFAQASSVRCGVGLTRERLNRMSCVQSMASAPAGTPLSAKSRAAWTASAALTRIFFGTQPRSAHVPPNWRESTTATVQPASRHRDATAEVTPVPTTTRSNCRSMSPPTRVPTQRWCDRDGS